MLGFINNVAQMIIMTRGCVANKNHVTSSKCEHRPYYNESLLYPAHNFVLHGGISKLHGKTFVVHKDHVASFRVKSMIQNICYE